MKAASVQKDLALLSRARRPNTPIVPVQTTTIIMATASSVVVTSPVSRVINPVKADTVSLVRVAMASNSLTKAAAISPVRVVMDSLAKADTSLVSKAAAMVSRVRVAMASLIKVATANLAKADMPHVAAMDSSVQADSAPVLPTTIPMRSTA